MINKLTICRNSLLPFQYRLLSVVPRTKAGRRLSELTVDDIPFGKNEVVCADATES